MTTKASQLAALGVIWLTWFVFDSSQAASAAASAAANKTINSPASQQPGSKIKSSSLADLSNNSNNNNNDDADDERLDATSSESPRSMGHLLAASLKDPILPDEDEDELQLSSHRVESWLDEHRAFVHDYFVRKATRQMVDDWLKLHANTTSRPSSSASSTSTSTTSTTTSTTTTSTSTTSTTPAPKVQQQQRLTPSSTSSPPDVGAQARPELLAPPTAAAGANQTGLQPAAAGGAGLHANNPAAASGHFAMQGAGQSQLRPGEMLAGGPASSTTTTTTTTGAGELFAPPASRQQQLHLTTVAGQPWPASGAQSQSSPRALNVSSDYIKSTTPWSSSTDLSSKAAATATTGGGGGGGGTGTTPMITVGSTPDAAQSSPSSQQTTAAGRPPTVTALTSLTAADGASTGATASTAAALPPGSSATSQSSEQQPAPAAGRDAGAAGAAGLGLNRSLVDMIKDMNDEHLRIEDDVREQASSLRHFIIICSVLVVLATSLVVALIISLCK